MTLRVVRRGLWTVFATCNVRGDCPLLKFLYEGSTPTPFGFQPRGPIASQKVRMLARLADMAEAGPPRNVKICHQIEEDIWQVELGRIRILWFYDEGRVIVLSHGFIKKTQRTTDIDKGIARAALDLYREAKATRRLRILED
jgi:phage-related protein